MKGKVLDIGKQQLGMAEQLALIIQGHEQRIQILTAELAEMKNLMLGMVGQMVEASGGTVTLTAKALHGDQKIEEGIQSITFRFATAEDFEKAKAHVVETEGRKDQ